MEHSQVLSAELRVCHVIVASDRIEKVLVQLGDNIRDFTSIIIGARAFGHSASLPTRFHSLAANASLPLCKINVPLRSRLATEAAWEVGIPAAGAGPAAAEGTSSDARASPIAAADEREAGSRGPKQLPAGGGCRRTHLHHLLQHLRCDLRPSLLVLHPHHHAVHVLLLLVQLLRSPARGD